jgi:outer membrane lipoprotein-sorting protein
MKKLSILFALTLTAFAMSAQTADEVVEKYLKAIGGADKWKKLESMVQTCKGEQQGMSFPVTVSSMRPNLMKIEVDIQGMKMIPQAYDGTIGWSVNPFGGGNEPTKMDEDATKEIAKSKFEDEFIDYKTKGHTVTLEGTEEAEGTKCFKIKIALKEGGEKIYFMDTENYIPIMIREFAMTGPMKGQASESVLGDYKEVDGMMMPHSIEQKVGGQTQAVIKVEKIEINPKIDKAIFAFPAAALIQKNKYNLCVNHSLSMTCV